MVDPVLLFLLFDLIRRLRPGSYSVQRHPTLSTTPPGRSTASDGCSTRAGVRADVLEQQVGYDRALVG